MHYEPGGKEARHDKQHFAIGSVSSRPFRPLLARRFNTRSNQWSVKAFADVMESKIGDNSQLVDCILKESRGKLEVLFFSKNVQ